MKLFYLILSVSFSASINADDLLKVINSLTDTNKTIYSEPTNGLVTGIYFTTTNRIIHLSLSGKPQDEEMFFFMANTTTNRIRVYWPKDPTAMVGLTVSEISGKEVDKNSNKYDYSLLPAPPTNNINSWVRKKTFMELIGANECSTGQIPSFNLKDEIRKTYKLKKGATYTIRLGRKGYCVNGINAKISGIVFKPITIQLEVVE